MVKKIVGYGEDGSVVFEREAREYDQGLKYEFLGIKAGDILKAVTIVFLGGMLYANQQNVNSQLSSTIFQVSESNKQNAMAISGIRDVLQNLNNYLSASTGKQFLNGRPQ